MMIQQNVITSNTRPIEARKARIRLHSTFLAIMLILGLTLMFSLYVYQVSVIYKTQLTIQSRQQDYARHERLNTGALTLYAKTQSMDAMVRRAQASGYGPPTISQIKYVRTGNDAPVFVQSNTVTAQR